MLCHQASRAYMWAPSVRAPRVFGGSAMMELPLWHPGSLYQIDFGPYFQDRTMSTSGPFAHGQGLAAKLRAGLIYTTTGPSTDILRTLAFYVYG